MSNRVRYDRNMETSINEIYSKISSKLGEIDEKPLKIKGNTRSNLSELSDRVGIIERDAGIIKWFLGACLIALITCIGGIITDICRDNSIQTSFEEKELRILNELNNYKYKIIQLEAKQESYDKYIDEKMKNLIMEEMTDSLKKK